MKKVLYTLISLFIFSVFYSNVGAYHCDQIFEGTTLRYNANYKFYDVWHAGSKDDYMNHFDVDFVHPEYLDKGSSYDWTQDLRNSGFKVKAGTSKRIIETGNTLRRIAKHPSKRTHATRNSYDFMIAYTITYDHSNNYPDSSDDIQHTECKYYSVSWCGDGVRDAGDEVCDPNDPNHIGWGNGGCDNTCKPINVEPKTTCDGLVANPDHGTAVLTSTLTCSATNANTYKIQCGNGKTINGKTGTCEYKFGGNYTAKCIVNGNITSNACTTQVSVTAPTPLIEVEKYSGNPNDLDGEKSHIPSDDSQTVKKGEEAVFIIKVTNNGAENLKQVTLNDPVASNCNRSDTQTKDLIKSIGNKDEILDVGESFTYTCNKENTQNDYENRINVSGVGVISGETVTDTDETQVKIVSPKILIVKTDNNSNDLDGDIGGNDSQTIKKGDKAIFKIYVENNGVEDLKEVYITDDLANECSKTKDQVKNILKTIGNKDEILNVGEHFEYNCEVDNPENKLKKEGDYYINEIKVDGKGILTNNLVTDDDPTKVIIQDSQVACTGLTVNPNSGNTPLSSNFICTGTNASNYKIEIKNSSGNLIYTINSNTGSYIFENEGNYQAICYVNSNVTSNSCKKNIVVGGDISSCEAGISGTLNSPISENTPNLCKNNGETPVDFSSSTNGNTINYTWSCKDSNNIVHTGGNCSASYTSNGGGGGGGVGPICYDIKTSGNTVTCYGNHKTKSFRIDCGNGTNLFISAQDVNDGTNKKKGTATCTYTSTNPKVSEPRCYVSGLALALIPNPKENYSGWSTRNQCQATTNPYCGDGILQPERGEECEKDSSGNWPSICNTNCTIKNPSHGGGGVTTIPGNTPGVITIPNHGNIIFGEQANIIIYKGQSVAEKVANPYIKNDSDYDLNLKAICVVQTSGNTLTRPSVQPNCKALPAILYPGQKVEFPGAFNDYKGKEIPDGQNYGDNVLKITYQNHRGEILDWAYFATPVKVRVAKPSIITTGGGTSYIRNTKKVSDIHRVARGVVDSSKEDNNKNFVGTSVSSLDSLSDKTTDSNIVDKVEDTGSGYENNIKDIDSSSVSTPSTTVSLLDKQNYNGMKNVFIFKNKNLKIDTNNPLSSFNGPITFIVENGNLYINKDIIYNDNVAFVVKGGNIVIDKSVTRMDGTYITIKKGAIGGNFISNGETADTLVINGSIYGNIDDLVSHRVNFENNNGNLTVGTVVSFGSSLFKKPAPLVSQFIEEYLNQQKIAQ